VVVSFKGSCDGSAIPSVPVESGALGWTHTSNGEVLPFTDIDCDRIRRLVGPVMTGVEREDRDPALGRALGRVLAHELYHVFAKTKHHSSWGIAKAFYTPLELMAEKFRFEPKEFKLLRNSKVRTVLEHAESFGAGGQ